MNERTIIIKKTYIPKKSFDIEELEKLAEELDTSICEIYQELGF